MCFVMYSTTCYVTKEDVPYFFVYQGWPVLEESSSLSESGRLYKLLIFVLCGWVGKYFSRKTNSQVIGSDVDGHVNKKRQCFLN